MLLEVAIDTIKNSLGFNYMLCHPQCFFSGILKELAGSNGSFQSFSVAGGEETNEI